MQFTFFNCGSDGTAGLVFMTAICISTFCGKHDNFLKTYIDPIASTYNA